MLARYRYILSEIHFLNESTNKHLLAFQQLATVVIGAGIAIFISWQKLEINVETAILGVYGLFTLFVILALFIILSILANVFSWIDYRNEESDLLDKVVEKGFRSRPSIKNFWRWNETWIIIFIFLTTIFISLMTKYYMIPLIH